jgi:hypothetical protein
MGRHPYIYACAVAAVTGLLAVIGALTLDLPFRDPDGFIGPAYIRLPVIVMFFLLLDIAPSWFRGARATGQVWSTFRRLAEERWSLTRLGLIVAGLAAFYVTYVGYRNLKGYLPFVREELVDGPLHALDRTLLLGNEPGPWLHDLLGTGISAQILSVVYVSYLLFVPMSLAAALIWSRDMSRGFWYVTALCLNWTLGIVSYYMLPSLGPVFAYSYLYEDLPQTGCPTCRRRCSTAGWTSSRTRRSATRSRASPGSPRCTSRWSSPRPCSATARDPASRCGGRCGPTWC